ncbi:MAG: hypothetical protein IJW40_03970 [Clostridia bacterium]|nr:hypothetical protein [Clostridia bacterium]
MKKALIVTLTAAMLLTSLTSCRAQEQHDYFADAMEKDPELELPTSEVMEVDPEDLPQFEINDALSNYEEELTFDIPAKGDHAAGELVVKYKIYDFAYEDCNVAIVSVENHSTQALTVSIEGLCENTLEGKTKSITRGFEGFAAGWQNYFIFDPNTEFDEFSYDIDFEYYDGETYGQHYQNLEFVDLRLWSAEFLGDGGIDVYASYFYDYTGEPEGGYAWGYVLFDEFEQVLHCDDDYRDWHLAYTLDKSDPHEWPRSHTQVFIGTDNSFLWSDLQNLGQYNFASPSNYEPGEGFEVANGIVAFNATYPEITQEALDRIAAGLQ